MLVVPLDPQDGGLSRLLGADLDRSEPVDTLVRHMSRRPKGEFHDLIRTAEHDIDIVSEHNMLADVNECLQREADQAEPMGEIFAKQLWPLRTLRQSLSSFANGARTSANAPGFERNYLSCNAVEITTNIRSGHFRRHTRFCADCERTEDTTTT